MLSGRWPAPRAHDPATLEARMDDLHRKLDQLLSRSPAGGCSMCGICSHHSKQQESIASQLSAQARLLDSLERTVAEVRTALEDLASGLEERSSDRISVPAVALQRRKSLPVRTSVDEVYVRLDLPREKIKQNAFNVLCGKGQTGVLIEDSEGEGPKGEALIIREAKDQHEPQPRKEVHKKLSIVVPQLAASQPSHEPANMAKIDGATSSSSSSSLSSSSQKPSKSTGVAPPTTTATLKVPPKVAPKTVIIKNSTITSQNQTALKPTEVPSPVKSTSPATTTTKPTVSGAPALPSNQNTPKPAGLVATSSVPNNPPNSFTITEIKAPPPLPQSSQKACLAVPVATSQSLGKFSSTTPSPHVSATPDSQQPNCTITKTTTVAGAQQASNHLPGQIKTNGVTSPPTTTTTTSPTPAPITSTPKTPPTETVTSSHKPVNVMAVGASAATSQKPASEKPSTNSQTTKQLETKKSPSGSTLSAPKTAGLMVPSATAVGSTLKHVASCPESLQRFQGSGGKAESTPASAPLLVKPGTVAARSTSPGQMLAGGIQIRISPAAPERSTTQTKTPPKTCLKVIDDVPPQQAPFPHRCVSLRPSPPCDYSIHTREVLGGGRFGKVHKCTDNKTGLRLAAKLISARGAKDRETALNEIQVMNQLSHPNILQLYDAFEAKNQVVLILEYVEGGELFERIVDENSPLTEVDAMVFVKQICEGVQYMHQMYVLHLDLKPENILCVNRPGHQIKIIDFGLARRYKPREKLRVSFGTPEFLAPEVVNFDFVSFPTDMWTLGVVTYMLLSGLSPFLGDDDSQTLNNVLTVNWYFDEDAFEHVSDDAKDFVSNLLIRERSGRFSATQCLKHPWLNNISEKAKGSNIVLKSQVLLKKYMARRLWKKNYIAIAAANRFKKICSSGSLTSMGV
ncbi:myosin light chain kinase 2, skeletal/cardiac muscle isoform X1 [Astyanax mexicanus]|uniref:myosin light chain kinase 2, skeletal/cardiac muscle isoform X1 n=1 Tax=Astyanax mexicanus TaxID=7994 RepID=UPI0020CB00CE|nr:myosin light chain kinase 2, skeletal/cardiac muscle isoform X1 [Astyanax mexicanus]